MPICQLCLNDRELCQSHIVPEFLYKKLYNANDAAAAITGLGNKGYKLLQKGLCQYLLCDDCEQHLNKHFKIPFQNQWTNANPLPNPWIVPEPYWVKVDYDSFKLFHLSILFRASVSNLPNFATVSLGVHQDKIRKMILNLDSGQFWQYPIYGFAVIRHDTKEIVQAVTMAKQSKYNAHRFYGIIYGGVQWLVSVSSHRNHEHEDIALQQDGRIPFHVMQWNELEDFQFAAKALSKVCVLNLLINLIQNSIHHLIMREFKNISCSGRNCWLMRETTFDW